MNVIDYIKNNYKLIHKKKNTDTRDYKYISETSLNKVDNDTILLKNVLVGVKFKLPSFFSIRNKFGFILDQGEIGSCVSNAISMCIYIIGRQMLPSRLYHYCIARIISFEPINNDSGLDIRTACKAVAKYGVCPERFYIYNTALFSQFPYLYVFRISRRLSFFRYTFINQDLDSLKQSLLSHRTPIIFGFLIYDSFMTNEVYNTGIVPMPDTENETLLGGHCMLLIGYNDSTNQFICCNSWGKEFGDGGFCYMPYDYLTNTELANDFCYLNLIH